jgi:hypothetical protein
MPQTEGLPAIVWVVSATAALSLLLCFAWGRLVARTALRTASPKWKAYVAALAPVALFSAGWIVGEGFTIAAGHSFFLLGSPVLIGTCFRLNRTPRRRAV